MYWHPYRRCLLLLLVPCLDVGAVLTTVLSFAQVAFFLAYFLTVSLWLYATYLYKCIQRHVLPDSTADIEKSAEQKALLHKTANADADLVGSPPKILHATSNLLEEMWDSAAYR
jgi:hypothetical protein